MKNYQLLRDQKQKEGFMITMRKSRRTFRMWWRENEWWLVPTIGYFGIACLLLMIGLLAAIGRNYNF